MRWYLDPGPECDVVISSRVRLARNLRHYQFPAQLPQVLAEEAYEEIAKAFFSANEKMKEDYLDIRLRELPEVAQQSLVEKRLISEDLLQHAEVARVLLRKDEGVSLLLGEEDHLRIQVMQAGLRLQAAFEEAERLSLLLEEQLDLAFATDYGFLTACPTNVGTGLRASVMLHLPALARSPSLNQYLDALRKAGFAVRGTYGEHSQATGFLFQISNQFTLGLSEEESLHELEVAVTDLVRRERLMRKRLLKEYPLNLMDQIYRSYGVLSQARLLNSEECQEHLSNLRLGMALGKFPELSPERMNQLANTSGPGALQQEAGRLLSPEERDALRATRFREGLRQDLQNDTNERE